MVVERPIEGLGDWVRTHYSVEVTPKLDGKQVIVCGWVRELRTMGKLNFIKLADREGFIQITAKSGVVDEELINKIVDLGREWVIAVKGTVRKNKEAPGGREIIPIAIRIVNKAEAPLPMEVETKKTPAELPTRLDWRFIDLRKPEVAAIFNITDTIKRSFFEYFDKEGFIDVNPPIIVGAATEGGAELFPVSYFDREAFLNQSPQLYKQILLAAGFDKVSMVTPVFRAEPHDSYRHLNELIQMDIEVAWINDEEGALKYFDGFVPFAIKQVNKYCKQQLATLQMRLSVPKAPITRLTYDDALAVLKDEFDIELPWGSDLTPEAERKICEHVNPVLITKWPTEARAFYAMPEPDNPKICRAYDLLYNGIEIASGAQRIHIFDDLIKSLKAKNIDPSGFKFYLDAFRYGMPPHGGWSIGLERFVMALLKLSNIREARLFPRTRERITP
ncbi:MAG: aspartate--tRNA(Asn) ligase [Candidatus Aenigmatarchaeota archaeon]|nr:aspartate--tRNA(Asn) ligase [Candidatus Aenigmarchaeota archaeon]